ncbi:MAG: DUF563 domain-containing protein [Paracoccaceae bacterium]
MNAEPPALNPPNPYRGWATRMHRVKGAIVVPPETRLFRQKAGILKPDGQYVGPGALWRKTQEITSYPDMPTEPPAHLPGRWMWGGVLWRHFGHFVVESTGRLWGLSALDLPLQGILFIPKSPKYGDELAGFHKEFFDLAGARGVDVRVLTQPTQVDKLLIPGQGLGIGRIILGTKACRDFYRDDFAKDVKPDGPERLYISRSLIGPNKGALVCEHRLEEWLADQGYEVFHPQHHDLRTQIARYRAARQVIAAEGSAIHMFGLVAREDQQLAIIVRRMSKATKYIEDHVRAFAGIEPLTVNEVRRIWKPEGRTKPRFARGEPDYPAIQRRLTEAGFLSPSEPWAGLNDDDVLADLSRGKPRDMKYVVPGG